MPPILFLILATGLAMKIFNKHKLQINNSMANCHNLFYRFNEEISITTSKRNRLIDSKEKLRERIRKYFKENYPDYEPKFFIQGSYKMKTIIRTKDDICDLDDGVYFFREPDVTATTLQSWVYNAVNGYTSNPSQHRKKCIRTIFSADYEIDMPVYYKVDGSIYQIAIKNEGWRNDDPKAMVDWFKSKKGKEKYLLSAVKYLKAWCDNKRNAMPSGLSMTILAANAKDKLVLGERDDINLTDVLKEIKKTLNKQFECIVPVAPNDNLFADYDEKRRSNFLTALDDFIMDADAALKEDNQLKASKLWRKHLGDRFPLGEDKSEDKNSNTKLISGIGLSSPYGTL
ncbi:hypothetical protein F0919_08035 [Taibaiella lutea]|uniref:Cyclic GMP-AMP synthase n=1 Tax=Taibaiella lutea TaxID=2608001 RepID=A0A5M6CH84_9BACT|nr:hypothetical protein [Taibaiella lutea]KAA5534561.1 hypothetical protein F0919_08035 [Taibaiella lutea]